MLDRNHLGKGENTKLLKEVYIGGKKTIDQYIVSVAYNLSSFV